MQDADLRSRVTHLLHMRQIRDLRNVAVEVVDGTATLHGKVRSFYHKQLCLSCCQRVSGIAQIVDRIDVE